MKARPFLFSLPSSSDDLSLREDAITPKNFKKLVVSLMRAHAPEDQIRRYYKPTMEYPLVSFGNQNAIIGYSVGSGNLFVDLTGIDIPWGDRPLVYLRKKIKSFDEKTVSRILSRMIPEAFEILRKKYSSDQSKHLH